MLQVLGMQDSYILVGPSIGGHLVSSLNKHSPLIPVPIRAMLVKAAGVSWGKTCFLDPEA